jgi:transcriptional regulator with XRE-family HTH domain
MTLLNIPIQTYEDLVGALKERRASLGMSQLDMDARTGLADGLVAKIECGSKRLGPISTPCLLTALGLRIVLVPVEDLPSLPTIIRRAQEPRRKRHPRAQLILPLKTSGKPSNGK